MENKKIILKSLYTIFGGGALYIIILWLLTTYPVLYLITGFGGEPLHVWVSYTLIYLIILFYFFVSNLVKKRFEEAILLFFLLVIIGVTTYYLYNYIMDLSRGFSGMIG